MASLDNKEIKIALLIHGYVCMITYIYYNHIYLIYIITEVGIPQKYAANNVTALKALVEAVDALEAHDGGDCAELGMTGILNALSLANLDSNIVVLTDASPKDVKRMDATIAKATKLRNSIHFFLSYDCGDFTPYLKVAKDTYGIVMHEIEEFEAFAKFANKVGKFNTKRHLGNKNSKEKRRAFDFENCEDISTSVFTKSIDVFFSSVKAGSEITVTNPLGTVEKIKFHGYTATYSNNPVAGKYKFCSTDSFEYSFSIPSKLNFLVEYVDHNVSSTSLPAPGMSAELR